MLDTWRPLLCPHAPSMKKAIRYFSLFLPTIMLPGQETWLLWFEEFMGIWQSFASVTSWENDLIALFSRLALDNIGSVNWTPYISFIFTKFLRNLRLPVGKKRVKLVGENRSFDSVSAAIWPVAMLHQDECLLALEDLFKAVEAYFYPSNYGDWTTKLSGMLMKLPQCVVSRLNMERCSIRRTSSQTSVLFSFHPSGEMKKIQIEFVLKNDFSEYHKVYVKLN
jgi:proteasome activator subunit 4